MKFKKCGFTFTEMLVSIGIFALIGGGVIIAMSRGASNVHMGSFTATASNQAAWIVTMMRRDIARSQNDRISFKPDTGNKWTGTSEFSLLTNNGEKIKYSIEKRGGGKAFCRLTPDGRKMFLASEYLTDFSVEQINDYLKVNMLLRDPGKKAADLSWEARIFPPVPLGADRFWKPISEIK